jgi:transposase, IS30 family
LPSTRRVKKGPGRRPQSAKRQRFMELRARGWSVLAAAREVGVSRTTGANWARGYKTYRNGQPVGFVPPLDRLAVRAINARYLSQDERVEIADLYRTGVSIRQIAQRIGRSPSTISRELRRNGRADGSYRPFDAHRHAVGRRARHHRRRLDTNTALRRLVGELLGQRWSPQQISRHLRAHHPDDPGMRLCHESIYQAVYQPGSRLVRPGKVPSAHRSPLRTGRDHRRAQQKAQQRRPRFARPMLSIHQRPFAPADRTEPGHWEGDLIVGKHHGSAIGTLVERTTRMIRLLHLPQHDAQTLHAALTARMGDLPPALLRSITGIRAPRCPAQRHHRHPRDPDLLLRLTRAVAARIERECQRAAAPVLSPRNRPGRPPTAALTGRRGRDQQATPSGPCRPRTDRPFRRAASLARPAIVATLTGTHPVDP